MTLRRSHVPLVVLGCALLGAPSAGASFPGGEGRIVFNRIDHGRTTLLSAHPRTGRVQRLTTAARGCRGYYWSDHEPAVAPGGRLIAYVHEDYCSAGTADGIYVMGANGRGRRLVVPWLDRRYDVEWPSFDPDGRALTFVRRHVKSGRSALYRVLLDANPPAIAAFGGRFLFMEFQDDPDWSAQGGLALSTFGISALSGSAPATHVSRDLDDYAPSWSPSGDRIAFHRFAPSSVSSRSVATIYSASARGGTRARRLRAGWTALYPAWSPAGGRIAFVRAPRGDATRGDLAVMGPRGGDERLLVSNVVADRIAWQPLVR